MLVTDTGGVTYSVTGSSLTTEIVTATATAGAMIAQETVIITNGAGILDVPGVWVLIWSLVGVVVALA
jgi:hypothetical protein